MKLRLHNNSVRLRLNQNETAVLGAGKSVEAETVLGGGALRYSIVPREGSMEACSTSSGITVFVPAARLAAWSSSDEVGIYATQNVGGAELQILIEKDFQCLHREDDEENAGAFPNPALSKG